MVDACVVFHPGSYQTSVGVVGDDDPRVEFPTLASLGPAGRWDVAASFRDVAHFERHSDGRRIVAPYDHGVVTDWNAMEALLRRSLSSELSSVAHDALIITETPWATPRYAPGHREAWLELAFESCDRRAVLCASQPLLALMASGRTSGAALSVGHQVTAACTFRDGGQPLHFCRSDVGGADVITAFSRSMANQGYDFTSPAERGVLQDVKEAMTFVPVTADDEAPASACYELPDGDVLKCLGEQRVRCYDALFAPPPESGALGVTETLASAVLPDAEDIVQANSVSVALCGGTTLACGFDSRVQVGLDRVLAAATAGDPMVTGVLARTNFSYRSPVPIRVIAPPDRKYSEWIGGSILGSLSTSADWFVTKAAYDEAGAAAAARLFDQFSY